MAPPLPLDPTRRSFRLTWPGVCWAVTAAGLLALGLSKNINLLSLLGYFLLAVLLANVLLAGRGLRSLKVRRRHGDPVFAGQPVAVEVTVLPGRRAWQGVWLGERGPDHALQWRVTRPGGAAGLTFRDRVVPPRRGRYARGPLWAVSGYPFGLFERRVRLAPPEEILVLPRLGTVRRGGLRRQLRGADPTGERQQRRPPSPAAQGEVHGLRGFRTGDSPRMIHWKTSARRGELMVREFEDVPGDSMLLALDPALPDGPDAAERFEQAVSLAATVAREWCRGGADRLVVAAAGPTAMLVDGSAGPGTARRALEILAEAVPDGDAVALLGRIAALANAPAGAVLVTAGPSLLSVPLRRLLRRPVITFDVTDAGSLDFYEPPREPGSGEYAAPPLPPADPPGTDYVR
jgi:uncharacterized protein (DUF58 family)